MKMIKRGQIEEIRLKDEKNIETVKEEVNV